MLMQVGYYCARKGRLVCCGIEMTSAGLAPNNGPRLNERSLGEISTEAEVGVLGPLIRLFLKYWRMGFY
jgi:hypothetical protein